MERVNKFSIKRLLMILILSISLVLSSSIYEKKEVQAVAITASSVGLTVALVFFGLGALGLVSSDFELSLPDYSSIVEDIQEKAANNSDLARWINQASSELASTGAITTVNGAALSSVWDSIKTHLSINNKELSVNVSGVGSFSYYKTVYLTSDSEIFDVYVTNDSGFVPDIKNNIELKKVQLENLFYPVSDKNQTLMIVVVFITL